MWFILAIKYEPASCVPASVRNLSGQVVGDRLSRECAQLEVTRENVTLETRKTQRLEVPRQAHCRANASFRKVEGTKIGKKESSNDLQVQWLA